MKRISSAAAAVGAFLAPAAALACPYCATRSSGGIGQSIALGMFLLLPFTVAGVVITILRSADKRREAE
jgi:hypothetical protein